MPRVTVSLPKDTHEKLLDYAKEKDVSLSSAVTKMCEIGLIVSEGQSENTSLDEMTDVEKHCYKLTIQMNSFMKNIAAKQLGYTAEEFDKIRDGAIKKFNELAGITPEEL